jgi:hypothetical protein
VLRDIVVAARPVERREQCDRRGYRLCCFRVADRIEVMHKYAYTAHPYF